VSTTWVLTCSPENHLSTREHAFAAIGIKERNRRRAARIAVGDRVVLHLTGAALGARRAGLAERLEAAAVVAAGS